MKLPTKLVAVNRVISSVSRSSFDAEQIDKAAHLIISVEGIINPIIVRRTSFDSYEVVDGHFEYYAAVRARELSLAKGEMIQAIILEPDNEEALLEQVNILRGNTALVSTPVIGESTYTGETINLDQVVNLETQFVNLERIFKAQFDELQKSNRHLESRISELATQSSIFHNPKLDIEEELITQIASKVVESITPLISSLSTKSLSAKSDINLSKASTVILLDLNSASIEELSKIPGIKEKATEVIKLRTTKGRFSSFEELHDIKGIKGGTTKNLHKYLVIKDFDS